MAKGYYSVVQYNPDPSRGEAANIGVVLFCPGEPARVLSRNSDKLSRVKAFFKPDADRLWRVAQALESNGKRLTSQCRTVEDLVQFTRTLANDIRMTVPMVVRVNDAAADLERLFGELVEQPVIHVPKVEAVQDALPAVVKNALEDLVKQNRVRRPGPIAVPLVHREIDIPYAYQNGVLNLIKPTTLPRKVEVSDSIIRLAVEGDLINTIRVAGESRKLVVVSAEANRPKDEGRVAALFGRYNVRFVTRDQAAAFADQVRLEAK